MKILDLKIRNLGRHKYLHAELDGPVIGLLGKNGCLAGDTIVTINRLGVNQTGVSRRISLKELVFRFNGGRYKYDKGWDLNIQTRVQAEKDGYIRLANLVGACSSGVKETYWLTTTSGNKIRATADHRFMTDSGWRKLHELAVGDSVLVNTGKQKNKNIKKKSIYRRLSNLIGHPYARRKGYKEAGAICPTHRIVAEAEMNGLAMEDFVTRLRTNKVEGLKFLNPSEYHVHHIDENPQNNKLQNLQILTAKDHLREHGDMLCKNVAYMAGLDTVSEIKFHGEEETFDLTLEEEPHNFVANNFVVHNSGKSTILRIIQFLFTGSTPAKETQESFIRRVDPSMEEEPTWGDAEIKFSSQGANCILYKRIGVGASRRFEVDDKVYTRADDIQAALTDILGADKYAIDNAVFPAQGELSKILFGGQADREELLVKLLLLGHMQKVADTAASKIKILGSEIQDFSVLHDELLTSRRLVEEEFGRLSVKLDQATCYDEEIRQFRQYNDLEKELIRIGDIHRRKQTDLSQYRNEIATLLTNIGSQLNISIASPMELSTRLSQLDTYTKGKHSSKEDLLRLKANSTIYRDLHERYHALLADRAVLIVSEPKEPDRQMYADIQNRINKQRERDRLKADLTAHKLDLSKFESILNRSKEHRMQALGDEVKLADTSRVESDTLSLYKTIVETCALALQKTCTSECPVCGSELEERNLKIRHAQYSKLYTEQQEAVNKIRAEWQAAVKLRSECDMAITASETNIVRLRDSVREVEDILDAGLDVDTAALEKESSYLDKALTVAGEFKGRLAKMDKDKADLEVSLAKYSEEDKNYLTTNNADIDAKIAGIDIDLAKWDPVYKTLLSADKTVSSFRALIESAESELETSETRMYELKLETGKCVAAFTPRLQSIVANSEDIEAELNNKNIEYTELRVKTEQMKVQAQGLKRRLLEVEQKIALDSHKREVIAALQSIVTAFSRQGIPMAYVQHKFDSLVSMTQENLEIMDANFAILPHTTRPVSLQFYRVDEPGQVLFDHEKLSGGQKVRLSVAFLLAVQQLVIPDLGFLVLDEPSTHLDEESRENLKDLLLNLGQQLETTDTQIFVCDHAHELQPAFFHTIEL